MIAGTQAEYQSNAGFTKDIPCSKWRIMGNIFEKNYCNKTAPHCIHICYPHTQKRISNVKSVRPFIQTFRCSFHISDFGGNFCNYAATSRTQLRPRLVPHATHSLPTVIELAAMMYLFIIWWSRFTTDGNKQRWNIGYLYVAWGQWWPNDIRPVWHKRRLHHFMWDWIACTYSSHNLRDGLLSPMFLKSPLVSEWLQ